MANSFDNPDNECYNPYPAMDYELPSGLLNMSSCRYPNWCNASLDLQLYTVGLNITDGKVTKS